MMMKNGMGHKDNRGQRVYIATGKMGRWVSSGNLAFCSGTELTLFRNLQKGSLTCEERDIFHNTVHHYGLHSGNGEVSGIMA